MTIVPGTPRWAVLAAWAVPLCVLPSAIYRMALLPSGYGSVDVYLTLLSAGSMALALLTVGLTQPWGERFPRWIPWLGGRAVSRTFAVGAAVTGASIVILVCLYAIVNPIAGWVERGPVLIGPDQGPMPQPGAWVVSLYAPLLAWGPLVIAVATAYRRRRS